MNALSYLFFVKLKAQLRRLFSKPTSAIVTLLVVGFFGFSIYSAVQNREMMSAMMNVQSVQGWMMLFCGYVLFLMTIMILQKRSAIVTRDDAQFIFAGPFTRKQTLAYLLIETVEGSLIYALIAVAYILMMMSSTVILTVPLVLSLILSSLLMFYFAFALFTWFYFLELVKPRAKWLKYGFLAALLGFIGLIAIRNVGFDGGGIQSTITRFVADPLFNWVPVFGWCKMALIGLVSQDMTACLIGFAATFLVCAGITALILNVKGDFYEQAIMDAEWISELRQNARARRSSGGTNEKVVSVKQARFGSGAAALVSKNLLILRKTRRLLSLQEVLLIAIYLGIVWMNGQGFGFYQFFVLIVLFTSATTDRIAQDLRVFYLYLIPDRPLKKLAALMVPSMLHIVAVVFASLVFCPFVLGCSWAEILPAALMMTGFGWLFLSASLVCLRLMKSRSTPLMEQMIKMVFCLVLAIPYGITVVALMFVPGLPALAVQLAGLAVNGLIGLACLALATPLLSGNNLMAD